MSPKFSGTCLVALTQSSHCQSYTATKCPGCIRKRNARASQQVGEANREKAVATDRSPGTGRKGNPIKQTTSLPTVACELSDDSISLPAGLMPSTWTEFRTFLNSQSSVDLPFSASLSLEKPPIHHKQSTTSLLQKAVRTITIQSRNSDTSFRSDNRPNFIFQNVSKHLQRTQSQLRRTRLLHVFYLLALPVYTLAGAIVFQTLDGEHDDRMLRTYDERCQTNRPMRLRSLKALCASIPSTCFEEMEKFLYEVEQCYRQWDKVNRTLTHSLSDFVNAVIYAFSVYSTIGYGNMAADTLECRVATVIYGAFGIPLFFAFVKEEGNLLRLLFIRLYKYIQRSRILSCIGSGIELRHLGRRKKDLLGDRHLLPDATAFPERASEYVHSQSNGLRSMSAESASKLRPTNSAEQRRVFIAGVLVFIAYLLAISGIFTLMTDWDYFTAFYFLFNSVALIGFGDVFPSEPRIILVNTLFIVLGVVLFSMCYFILQEEIREKAFEASCRARMSISKYSHTIMLHTRNPWSRRTSPSFDRIEHHDKFGFDQLRKRRQSAPTLSLAVPSFSLLPGSSTQPSPDYS